jgi:hypothetical protein
LVTCPYFLTEFASLVAAVDPYDEPSVNGFNDRLTCLATTCSPFVEYVYD